MIINDYSHFAWVYFLRLKDEIQGTFNTFNYNATSLDTILGDNKLSSRTSSWMSSWMRRRVQHEFFCTYSCQQNKAREMENHTHLEMATTMLNFWDKVGRNLAMRLVGSTFARS